jgi:tight adherence protein C
VELFGFLTANEMLPILVFVFIMIGTFLGLNAISSRNSHAEDRLERIGRPKSLTDLEVNAFESRQNFAGLRKAFSNLGSAM